MTRARFRGVARCGAALVLASSVAVSMPAAGHPGLAVTYPEELLSKVVRYSDLVVRGVITSIGSETVPYDSLFTDTRPDATFPITTIDVAVRNVIKGSWNDDDIVAAFRGDPERGGFFMNVTYDYAVGEKVIFCLRYNARILGGVFEIPSDACSLVRRGDAWVTRGIPVRKVSLDAIEREASAVALRPMAAEADAVALGSIEAVSRKEFDCGYDIACIADYVTVRVIDAWKGGALGDQLIVRAIRSGTNLSWYAPVPSLAIGQSYLMFLGRDDVGYYPFAGFNGFLEVDGERLLMNHHVPYPMSRSETIAIVEESLGIQAR